MRAALPLPDMSMRLLLRLIEEAGLGSDVGAPRRALNPPWCTLPVHRCVDRTIAKMEPKLARRARARGMSKSLSGSVGHSSEASFERLVGMGKFGKPPKRAQLLRHPRNPLVYQLPAQTPG